MSDRGTTGGDEGDPFVRESGQEVGRLRHRSSGSGRRLGRSGKRHDVDIARVLVRRLLAIIRRESARVERRRIGRCVRTTEDGGDSSLSRSKLENMGSVVVNADDCIEAMRGRFERGPPAPAAKDASPCEERDASDG